MEINNIDIDEIVKNVLSNLDANVSSATESNTTVPKQARVAYLTEIENIEVKTRDIPEISDDEVLVRVEGCGVCGTDLHEYKNDPFGLIPVVLGHEGTGEIAKLGKNVTHDILGKPLKVGDKIITSVTLTGDDVFTTLNPDKANLSDNSAVYGLLPDDDYYFNGWFGEYIILRKGSSIFKVNDLTLEQRLLVEPSAVAVHAVERAKSTNLLRFDTKVLVQGCGPIGLCTIAVLRTMGIETIVAVDGNKQRLEYAKELGADYTINFSEYNSFEDQLDDIMKVTDGGAEFAFQCTGVPIAASNLFKCVRRGGGLCEVGFFVDSGEATINPHWDLCQKEITLVGSWVYTFKDYVTTLDYLKRASGIGLPIEKLITHKFGLDELNEAMAVNERLEGIKVAYINK